MSQVTLLQGDALEVLRTIPSGSVQCCVTSPPYYGLRDYGVAGQIGLECTPDEYISRLLAVFAEVRRVLRDDGTLWLNLGDTYAANRGYQVAQTKDEDTKRANGEFNHMPMKVASFGVKPKDLIGIPWRVALALQADGWWLRSDIIWSKPNPMPESVTDRPTRAHEYIFLLAKSARYYYDAEAIKEPSTFNAVDWNADGTPKRESMIRGEFEGKGQEPGREAFRAISASRNRRDVWAIPTQPYPGAHFATYPEDLVEPCILAGTSARGACPQCGAPLERLVTQDATPRIDRLAPRTHLSGNDSMAAGVRKSGDYMNGPELAAWKCEHPSTSAWASSCTCGRGDRTPCAVLDPFSGSGTTGAVALRLGRSYIGIELNPDYIALSEKRLQGVNLPLFVMA